MESRQYRSIMQPFAQLADDYKDEIQIIVAATDTSGLENYVQSIRAT